MSRRDRRTVMVVLTLAGLIAGGALTYASVTARAEAFTDSRIEIKVTPRLDDHEKRLASVEHNSQETHDAVLEIRTLLRAQQLKQGTPDQETSTVP